MQTGHIGFQGFPPQVVVGRGNPEAQKYRRLWEMEEYRRVAPGESMASQFLTIAAPRRGAHVLDLGCGSGRGGLVLAVVGGLRVTLIDFARNCLDADVREMLTTQAATFTFLKADLEQPLPAAAEYGFCCDVMEHIPPENVDRVLDNCLRAATHCFFSISLLSDRHGELIGETLHLTVRPYEWWLEKFQRLGGLLHYADCITISGTPTWGVFYISMWEDGQKLVNAGCPNTDAETVRAHVTHNCTQGWQQVQPCEEQDTEVMILGGGPSLNEYEAEIRAQRAAGVKLVTLNGTYNWCLERGLTPSATIIVDAREFNNRFVRPVVDGCKYLMASQVHPSVLEGLPKDRTYLWHVLGEVTREAIQPHYRIAWPIPGGSTVLLRSIPLLRMLGFHRFHLYGCDSCLQMPNYEAEMEAAGFRQGKLAGEPAFDWTPRHHAYAQPENDRQLVVPVRVGDRTFRCNPWMASQAQEFLTLVAKIGEEFDLTIHGDGLLAHLITNGAALERPQEGEE